MSAKSRLSIKRNTNNDDKKSSKLKDDIKSKDIESKLEIDDSQIKNESRLSDDESNSYNNYDNIVKDNDREDKINKKHKITIKKEKDNNSSRLTIKKEHNPGVYPNTDLYPTFMKNKIDEELSTAKIYKLREHQHIVKQFMAGKLTTYKPRGILLYHLMGTGKTMAMISCAVVIGRPVLCIMSKSLVNNFMLGIGVYEKKFKTDISNMFSFVSLDAYNMIDQIKKQVGHSLDGITVVVDEAHELFTQIVNSENKNGPKLYEMIMHANDIHLIFGSGTPIIKDPFELVPCVNMLTGKNTLPTSYDDFMSLFVKDSNLMSDIALDEIEEEFQTEESKTKNNNNLILKNGDKLQNRLFGIISYATNNPALFPRKLPTIIERIPMTDRQLLAYRVAREAEIKELEKMFKKTSNGPGAVGQKMGKAKTKSSSTYRQKSRALCNGYYDPENKLDISTKVNKLMENINREKGKGIVYSQFKDAGVYRIAERMINEGWTNFRGNTIIRSHQNKGLNITYNNNTNISDDESDSLKGDIYERSKPSGGTKSNRDNKTDDLEGYELYDSFGFDLMGGKQIDEIENNIQNVEDNKINDDLETKENEEILDEENVIKELTEKETKIYEKEIDEEVIDKLLDNIDEDNNKKDTEDVDEIDEELLIENVADRESEDNSYENRVISSDGKTIKFRGKIFIRGEKSKTFAILDGDVPLPVRKQILETYNSPENLDGQLLCMLLVTTVGSRGITLNACKHSHYFEPYWYLFRMLQFETRANRDGSHLMLPDDEQTTQLFVYLSVFPTEVVENTKQIAREKKGVNTMEAKYKSLTEIETTDETLYFRSINRQYVLDNFLDVMKEVSIECPHVNKLAHLEDEQKVKINCKMCAPIGNKIYTDNVFEDIIHESPCKQLEETQEETKSITHKGITYEYSRDNNDAQESIYNIAIYKYDTMLKAYTRVEEYDDIFDELFTIIKRNK